MNSTLPSRWQEILRREAAENVGTSWLRPRTSPISGACPTLDGSSAGRGPGVVLAAQPHWRDRGHRQGKRTVRPLDGHLDAHGGPRCERRGPRAAPRHRALRRTPWSSPCRRPSRRASRPCWSRADLAPSRRSGSPACPECERRRRSALGRRFDRSHGPGPRNRSLRPRRRPKPPPLVINVGTRVARRADGPGRDRRSAGSGDGEARERTSTSATGWPYPPGRSSSARPSPPRRTTVPRSSSRRSSRTARRVQFEGWALQDGRDRHPGKGRAQGLEGRRRARGPCSAPPPRR